MWQTVGVVTVTAESETVTVGQLTTDTDQGRVWLEVASLNGRDMRPLGFAVLSFVSSSGVHEVGYSKYFPDTAPAVVTLGPGPVSSVSGTVELRPRSYNTRWLSVGLPTRVWCVKVSALVLNGQTDPSFGPRGFRNSVRKFFPSRGPVGPRGAWALSND